MDGHPVALIANYPIHGTLLNSENLQVSGDIPGSVASYFEKETGVPMLFINGAAGNLAPLDCSQSDAKTKFLNRYCAMIGDKIIQVVNETACNIDNIELQVSSADI